MDVEKVRQLGLVAAIGPLLLVIAFGLPVWAAVPTGICMLVGISTVMWDRMVQDHSPPR